MPLIRSSTADSASANTRECPHFHVQKLLGQGTFGRVYLVRESATGKLKALKRTQKWKRTASREVSCLEECRGSKGLITADSIFYSTTPGGFTVQNILMDFMKSSLQALLSDRRKEQRTTGNPPTSAPWIRSVACQIIQGVYELHSRGVLHRDLKPENVLVYYAASIQSKPSASDFLFRLMSFRTARSQRASATWVRLVFDSECEVLPAFHKHALQVPASAFFTRTRSLCRTSAQDALGCLLAELICLRPLFECESPSPPKGQPAAYSNTCPAEAIQLLTLVELLGSPSSQQQSQTLSPQLLAREALGRIDGVEPLNLQHLLLKLCPPRVNASVLLQHPYIKEHAAESSR
ncbi:hypothetical protein Efla_003893 [Eimeria flavescens]